MTNKNTEKLAELIVDAGRLIHRQTGCFGLGNISMLRFKLLQFIAEKNDPTMKDVASYLGVAPPTATIVVRRLISTGLITRESRQEDRRVVRVAITPMGKKIITNTQRKMIRKLHPMLDDLSDKETAALSAILNKIIEHYEK